MLGGYRFGAYKVWYLLMKQLNSLYAWYAALLKLPAGTLLLILQTI